MMGFCLYSFYIRYLIQCENQFYSETMIKQSFLRSYNLDKIQSQAQDQKKKLQVFYCREVQKIIKQRRQMDREHSKQVAYKRHRQEKLRLKEKMQEMKENRYSEDKESLRRTSINRKSPDIESPKSIQQYKKVSLFISHLELNSCFASVGSSHQSLKITTVANRTFHKKMLHTITSKLKQQKCFHSGQTGKPENNMQILERMKLKTNSCFHDSLENFNFQQKNSTQPRILNKIANKKTQASKLPIKKPSSQGTSMSVLNSPKFYLKFINEIKSKGTIKRQTQYEPE